MKFWLNYIVYLMEGSSFLRLVIVWINFIIMDVFMMDVFMVTHAHFLL